MPISGNQTRAISLSDHVREGTLTDSHLKGVPGPDNRGHLVLTPLFLVDCIVLGNR